MNRMNRMSSCRATCNRQWKQMIGTNVEEDGSSVDGSKVGIDARKYAGSMLKPYDFFEYVCFDNHGKPEVSIGHIRDQGLDA